MARDVNLPLTNKQLFEFLSLFYHATQSEITTISRS